MNSHNSHNSHRLLIHIAANNMDSRGSSTGNQANSMVSPDNSMVNLDSNTASLVSSMVSPVRILLDRRSPRARHR